QAALLEDLARELVEARLPRAGEVIDSRRAACEDAPDLRGEIERVRGRQDLVAHHAQRLAARRQPQHRLHEVGAPGGRALADTVEPAHADDEGTPAALE